MKVLSDTCFLRLRLQTRINRKLCSRDLVLIKELRLSSSMKRTVSNLGVPELNLFDVLTISMKLGTR